MQWHHQCPVLTAVEEDAVVVVAPLFGSKRDLDFQMKTGVEAALGEERGGANGPDGKGCRGNRSGYWLQQHLPSSGSGS